LYEVKSKGVKSKANATKYKITEGRTARGT